MFKKLFTFAANENGASSNGAHGNGPANRGLRVMEVEEPEEPRSAKPPASAVPVPPKAAGFDQIYQNAAVKPPQITYGILKVVGMADSSHLAGMTPEAKRCALLMALDAAGVEIEDLLQDAVVRQRALNDYEDKQEERLRDFEAAKSDENRVIQEELDRITSQYMARIQANLDEVAGQQDNFHAWQKRKQHECQRMNETAAFLVPQGIATQHNSLTAVLERASGSRR